MGSGRGNQARGREGGRGSVVLATIPLPPHLASPIPISSLQIDDPLSTLLLLLGRLCGSLPCLQTLTQLGGDVRLPSLFGHDPVYQSDSLVANARPQAGDTRTAIGSGLLQLGLTPRSAVGIYSVNNKGGSPPLPSYPAVTCCLRASRAVTAPRARQRKSTRRSPRSTFTPCFTLCIAVHERRPRALTCPSSERPCRVAAVDSALHAYAHAAHVITAQNTPHRPMPSAPTVHPHVLAEWLLFDSALHAYSMVSVPLYDTLGPDAVEFISNHAELAAVGVSAAVLPTLLNVLPRCPGIRVLVGAGFRSYEIHVTVSGRRCSVQLCLVGPVCRLPSEA